MNGVEDDRRTRELIAELERRLEHACAGCGRALCAHAYVLNVALGYRRAPHCADCLAGRFRRSRADFLEHVLDWVEARPCYSAAWRWAAREESPVDARRPACLWGDDGATGSGQVAAERAGAAEALSRPPAHDSEWDAGGMGCGDLVLELRMRMRDLAPGRVLLLTATDPGAPTDLPAWCRLTGNRLAGQEHPRYWIEKGT